MLHPMVGVRKTSLQTSRLINRILFMECFIWAKKTPLWAFTLSFFAFQLLQSRAQVKLNLNNQSSAASSPFHQMQISKFQAPAENITSFCLTCVHKSLRIIIWNSLLRVDQQVIKLPRDSGFPLLVSLVPSFFPLHYKINGHSLKLKQRMSPSSKKGSKKAWKRGK